MYRPSATNFNASATEDDGSCTYDVSTAPTTITSLMLVSGQIERLNMLKELETYLKTVNDGSVIDASLAKSMYSNDGILGLLMLLLLLSLLNNLKIKPESEQSNVEALIDELADLSVNGH